MLSLKIAVPFDTAPYVPATVGEQETLFQLSRQHGYTVEEEKLNQWVRERYPPYLVAGGGTNWHFHVTDRKFGWSSSTTKTSAAQRLVETLRALGAVPDFARRSVHEVNFAFFFDVSSEKVPAYYVIDTITEYEYPGRFPAGQLLGVTVFCRKPPDREIMENIVRLDATLHMLLRLCGISAVR